MTDEQPESPTPSTRYRYNLRNRDVEATPSQSQSNRTSRRPRSSSMAATSSAQGNIEDDSGNNPARMFQKFKRMRKADLVDQCNTFGLDSSGTVEVILGRIKQYIFRDSAVSVPDAAAPSQTPLRRSQRISLASATESEQTHQTTTPRIAKPIRKSKRPATAKKRDWKKPTPGTRTLPRRAAASARRAALVSEEEETPKDVNDPPPLPTSRRLEMDLPAEEEAVRVTRSRAAAASSSKKMVRIMDERSDTGSVTRSTARARFRTRMPAKDITGDRPKSATISSNNPEPIVNEPSEVERGGALDVSSPSKLKINTADVTERQAMDVVLTPMEVEKDDVPSTSQPTSGPIPASSSAETPTIPESIAPVEAGQSFPEAQPPTPPPATEPVVEESPPTEAAPSVEPRPTFPPSETAPLDEALQSSLPLSTEPEPSEVERPVVEESPPTEAAPSVEPRPTSPPSETAPLDNTLPSSFPLSTEPEPSEIERGGALDASSPSKPKINTTEVTEPLAIDVVCTPMEVEKDDVPSTSRPTSGPIPASSYAEIPTIPESSAPVEAGQSFPKAQPPASPPTTEPAVEESPPTENAPSVEPQPISPPSETAPLDEALPSSLPLSTEPAPDVLPSSPPPAAASLDEAHPSSPASPPSREVRISSSRSVSVASDEGQPRSRTPSEQSVEELHSSRASSSSERERASSPTGSARSVEDRTPSVSASERSVQEQTHSPTASAPSAEELPRSPSVSTPSAAAGPASPAGSASSVEERARSPPTPSTFSVEDDPANSRTPSVTDSVEETRTSPPNAAAQSVSSAGASAPSVGSVPTNAAPQTAFGVPISTARTETAPAPSSVATSQPAPSNAFEGTLGSVSNPFNDSSTRFGGITAITNAVTTPSTAPLFGGYPPAQSEDVNTTANVEKPSYNPFARFAAPSNNDSAFGNNALKESAVQPTAIKFGSTPSHPVTSPTAGMDSKTETRQNTLKRTRDEAEESVVTSKRRRFADVCGQLSERMPTAESTIQDVAVRMSMENRTPPPRAPRKSSILSRLSRMESTFRGGVSALNGIEESVFSSRETNPELHFSVGSNRATNRSSWAYPRQSNGTTRRSFSTRRPKSVRLHQVVSQNTFGTSRLQDISAERAAQLSVELRASSVGRDRVNGQ